MLTIALAVAANASGQSPVVSQGDKNQNVGVNNGLIVQQNITVSEPVRNQLRSVSNSDQGWLSRLTPGASNSPETACKSITDRFTPTASKQSLLIQLGSIPYLCLAEKCTIIGDKTTGDQTPLVTVRRSDKSLIINAEVYGPTCEVLATIDDNQPHINKNLLFGWTRPDAHTLILKDNQNRVPLDIEFLNPNTVRIKGIFYGRARFGVRIDNSNETQLYEDRELRQAPLGSACLSIAEGQIGYSIESGTIPPPLPSPNTTLVPSPPNRSFEQPYLLAERVITQIKDLQSRYQQAAMRISQEFASPYKHGQSGPFPSVLPDPLYQQLVIADDDASRSYAALQQQLISVRQSAIKCVQLTPKQLADDDDSFGKVNFPALRPTASRLLERNQPDTNKYSGVISYFEVLHTKLADYKCGMY